MSSNAVCDSRRQVSTPDTTMLRAGASVAAPHLAIHRGRADRWLRFPMGRLDFGFDRDREPLREVIPQVVRQRCRRRHRPRSVDQRQEPVVERLAEVDGVSGGPLADPDVQPGGVPSDAPPVSSAAIGSDVRTSSRTRW